MNSKEEYDTIFSDSELNIIKNRIIFSSSKENVESLLRLVDEIPFGEYDSELLKKKLLNLQNNKME